ncbi:MAG: response regulator [Nitrospirae bacterium]|nr:response regulator [Nitrospirota bacterium]MDA1304413.1 response regulator [Nitrospirota bacterium]
MTSNPIQTMQIFNAAIILIAEDDDGHASLIERNLKRCGHTKTCLRFIDGQEVLDFLVKVSKSTGLAPLDPYILFLDGCMPKMTGQEVLKHVHASHALQAIPLTIVTTTDDAHELESFQALGCTYHLKKPVEIQALRQIFTQIQPDNSSTT